MAKRLFTFNSKSLPWAAIVAVLVAVLFEAFCAVFDDRMYPEPYDGLRIKVKNQISQQKNNDSDVLIFGDCYLLVGVDPQIIEERTGLKTFNYATHLDHTIVSSYLFLKNHLRSCSKKPSIIIMSYIPELAVYSEKAFFQRAQPFLFEVKNGNFLELARILGFEKAMRLQFFSLKNRDFFLQGRFLKGLAKRKEATGFIQSVHDEKGYYKLYGEVVYSGYEKPSLYRYSWGFSPFFEKYLRLMLDLAQKNNILVLFPLFTAPIDSYENFYLPNYIPQIYAAYLKKLQKDFPNLVFWSWQGDFSDRQIYRDGVHLNRVGCVRLSQKLGDVILKIGLDGKK